ncbi:hypothetical protein SLE2022_399440 [Rubroshorea leprosula]
MRHAKQEPSCSAEQAINLISAVTEIHRLSSHELSKLLRDSENFMVDFVSGKGSSEKIDMEKLAGFLPLHLIAVLISSDRDEALFRYLLCGMRLLHSLCDLAPRHSKLEQILLDDVKVSEQLLDLVFYSLIVLNDCRKDIHNLGPMPLLHSALVACSLYLLHACISSHWQDLAQVLVVHPKVDVFMDVAFGAVHVVVMFLHSWLSAQHTDFCTKSIPNAEAVVSYLCQQAEASLQFLQFLSQQKLFRERLIRNKELCGNGVLFLVQSILKLNVSPNFVRSSTVMASISRLKAKVLSILLHLCEAESISYLDEVASSPRSLDLAKSVALEILELLKAGLSKDPKHFSATCDRTHPMGLLQLNAMRLADAFSDDSNFRSHITVSFTEFLSAIFSLSHGDFLSMWCSADLPLKEGDATLEYDSFAAAGWVLDSFSSSDMSNSTNIDFNIISNNMSQASYVHQRTSLFIKVIANLHCFVPDICQAQEKHFFLHKFLDCLELDPSKSLPGFSFTSGPQKTVDVCRNIRSLVGHAESLIPTFLNDDDMNLIRMFSDDFHSLVNLGEFEENRVQQEARSVGECPSLLRREPPNLNSQNGNLKEEMSENYAFQEEDQFFIRSNQIDQGDDVMEQDMMEDRDKSGTLVCLREIDRDVVNIETSGSDTSPTRVKNSIDQIDNSDFPKLNKHLKDTLLKVDTVQAEEKQRRKRKRTIMNDKQVTIMERALLDEPDMQRNTASIKSWADKLSRHGSEVTCSQLRNWLNNRKARLSRASKEALAILEAENAFTGNQGGPSQGHSHNTHDSPGKEASTSNAQGTSVVSRINANEKSHALTEPVNFGTTEFGQGKPGQLVMLMDEQGLEIGTGKVQQVQGKWCGKNLEETGTCVVDVVDLKADRWVGVPYASDASGTSFEEAEKRFGVIRVLWDSNKLFPLRPQ